MEVSLTQAELRLTLLGSALITFLAVEMRAAIIFNLTFFTMFIFG